MSKPKVPPAKPIALDLCDEMESRNPNVLGPERYEALKKGIAKHGFIQPILVYETDGRYVIVDGVHRVKAARELGMPKVTAVVAGSPEEARMLRLALNKIRGELNQTVVGEDLLALQEVYDLDELTLSGFTHAEINVLMDIASYDGDEDDLLSGAPLDTSEDVKPKSYNLTLKFESESQRALVKEWLESRGDTPEDALIEYAAGGK